MDKKDRTIEKDLYISWLNNEQSIIDNLDLEGVEKRIIELEKKQFETRTRLSKAHEKRQKLMGKAWSEHSKSISDPDFKVNLEADPRERKTPKKKLTKAEKNKQMAEAAGIDIGKLMVELAKKKAAKKAKEKEDGK